MLTQSKKQSNITRWPSNRTTGSRTMVDLRQDIAQPFNVAIIDEATQLVDASTAQVLSPHLKCLVLAGDNQQLPSTVISMLATKNMYGRRYIWMWYSLLITNFPTYVSPPLWLSLSLYLSAVCFFFFWSWFYQACSTAHWKIISLHLCYEFSTVWDQNWVFGPTCSFTMANSLMVKLC